MTLRAGSRLPLALALLAFASAAMAGTISVTTNVDEDNGNASAPASQGCSLREALQMVANNDGVAYKGCSGATVGGPNTIDLTGAGGTIIVNSLVPNPAGGGNVRNGVLPFIGSTPGALVITAGTVTCDGSPNGVRIFHSTTGAGLTLTGMSIGTLLQGCTTGGGGIGIWSDGGDLTLNGVSFTNVHSDSGGTGGAVLHSGGNLVINGGNFTNNGTDGGAENGDGGAIYMSNIELPKVVSMDGVTFTNNTAGRSGGAIYLTQTDALGHSITITGAVFTLNTANGGAGGTERGGGAIFAATDADHNLGNLDLFLVVNGQFTSNSAPNGQGGAILLAGGALSSIDLVTNPLSPEFAALFPANGGIVASSFASNTAGGTASSDALGGSGGAIYSRGYLSVVQSSFTSNSSTHGSGGAIALRNPTTAHLAAFGNVTFNGNTADQAGGAIANLHGTGTASLINDTVAGNTAAGNTTAGNTIAGGGAIYNNNGSASAIAVRNTILGGGTPGSNCAGQPVNDLGNNLQFSPDDTGCGAGMTIGNPNLASPSIFAGPNAFVFTMAINGNHSPAQGTGNQATCAAQPIVNDDATGRVGIRPAGDSSCDIGAFESSTAFPVDLKAFTVD